MRASEREIDEYYGVDGDEFLPTMLSASPWRRDAQNGVALGLLMAHTLEAQFDPSREQVARFTLDILHPAPFAPTNVTWSTIRADSRIHLFEGKLEARGLKAVRASALVLAAGESAPRTDGGRDFAPPAESSERELNQQSGLNVRLMRSGSRGAATHSRATAWVRVEADVTPGEPASNIAAAIAAADMGAVALRRYRDCWDFPNLDVAVHFVRPPHQGWLRVDTEPLMLGAGVCVINHRIFDGEGPCARAHQTLFFNPRRRTSA
ncbi:MAG TPA: acyl-CoA thioesterase domain-containing protein [Caulobacteraceae bacterium]|nr:acyl-CoA thioesterase domain-containing protein [Caulobacteraceae bacterium]